MKPTKLLILSTAIPLIIWAALAAPMVQSQLLIATTATGRDLIQNPPEHRTTCSSDGQSCFQLHLVRKDDHQAYSVVAKPTTSGDLNARLPHQLGPRYALVTNRGYLILLEEWYRSAESDFAIVIFDENLTIQVKMSLKDLVKATNLPLVEIDAAAKAGRWLSTPPQITHDGYGIMFEIAHKQFTLHYDGSRWLLSQTPG